MSGTETEAEIAARKEREKDELYSLDISGVEWLSAPGSPEEERVEIAYLPAVASACATPATPTPCCGTPRPSGKPSSWARGTANSTSSDRRRRADQSAVDEQRVGGCSARCEAKA